MGTKVRWRGLVAAGLVAGALIGARGASAAPLQLDVNFDANGNITVTLPNGTPIGTNSGSPTVIPAGYYLLTLTQPGCVEVPAFVLQGPGVNIVDDLNAGEEVTDSQAAVLQPNSTYVWRNGSINPPVNYTFVTSGSVEGTPPPATTPQPVNTGSNKAESNTSVLGQAHGASTAALPFRGTLAATVSADGHASLRAHGRAVTRIDAGRYTLTVRSLGGSHGFVLGNAHGDVVRIPVKSSTGTRSVSAALTAGTWFYAPGVAGSKTPFTVVG